MTKVRIQHIDAFSDIPGKGNPAGVVLNGEDFNETKMQMISAKVGFNETAFVLPSAIADFCLRFFTPGHEMNLCGHGTMGAIFALYREGLLNKTTFTIETKAGVLPIQLREENNQLFITMQQAEPQFVAFEGSKKLLAESIGLQIGDLHPDYPILYGSTGIWTLIVPIKNLGSFAHMEPQTSAFPSVLNEMPKASIHPICFEVRDVESTMHARHFSSPFSGTVEDAVTGTASGVMGAYYEKYVKSMQPFPSTIIVEQGHEINKDGKVYVHLEEESSQLNISISGTAVFVKDIEIEI
ncbi:MAG: PhzF family phenazine biosynthesis isomerase [Solibacillus sp.]